VSLVLVCWSVGGGAGTSVVVAGLAVAASVQGGGVLVVDLGGDQPVIFGVPEPDGPGVADWSATAPDVPADALHHLEVELAPDVSLVPRGAGSPRPERAPELIEALGTEERFVVVDAGWPHAGALSSELVAGAPRTLLVVRACPIALRRIMGLRTRPDGIVVVRDRRRSITWRDIAAAAGAPVVAELEVDPGVAAAVDAGLDRRSLPRGYLRVLDGLR
jgi:hypothetical protein